MIPIIYKILLILLVILQLSCVHTDEYTLPELNPTVPQLQGNPITIQALVQMIAQQQAKEGRNANVVFAEGIGIVTGYVVSNDKAGNFYKELLLQDDPIKPTAGIRILIDQNSLFTQYNFGRKVYVQLEGLAAGIENGVPTLGVLENTTIGSIGRTAISEIVVRSLETAAITPLELTTSDIKNEYLNVLVTLGNVQFSDDEVLGDRSYTLAAQPRDWFDGERMLISCKTGDTIIVSTSTFADFKGVTLPKSQGSITGILTKNYKGKVFNIVLNDPTGLVFEDMDRCLF